MARTNISQLYLQVFGVFGKRMPQFETEARVEEARSNGSIDTFSAKEQSERNSIFGTPIFMPCKIDDYWLPNEPLITITGGKNIVKTVVAGLEGTVKEEISTNDKLIVIKGIITNDDSDDYPEADVSKIREFCDASGSRKIVSPICRIFSIHEIAIESYNIFAIEGHQSQQAYQINAWSDRPVELILKEGL